MVWRRSLEGVLSVIRSERERFMREGIQAATDQEAAKNGDKARSGDRRRNQQTQPSQAREVEATAE